MTYSETSSSKLLNITDRFLGDIKKLARGYWMQPVTGINPYIYSGMYYVYCHPKQFAPNFVSGGRTNRP